MLAAVVFAVGASVGSFLNVAADRLPAGRSLIRPRSFCDSCGRTLTSLELVPIVSYLCLRGRCRTCGAGIPARTVIVELVTGALFMAAYLRFGLGPDLIVVCVALALLLLVALIDLEQGLILNLLMYPSMLLLVILAPFWSELGLSRPFLSSSSMLASLFSSLVAGAGAFLLFLAITLISPEGMGEGDVKLAGVLGLMVGFPGILVTLWVAVVTGGAVGLTLLLLRRKGRKDAIPFGPFLSLGAIATLLATDEVLKRYYDLTGNLSRL